MFVIFFTGNNESEDEIDTKNKSKALLNTFSIVQVFTIIGNCYFKTNNVFISCRQWRNKRSDCNFGQSDGFLHDGCCWFGR